MAYSLKDHATYDLQHSAIYIWFSSGAMHVAGRHSSRITTFNTVGSVAQWFCAFAIRWMSGRFRADS